MKTLLIGLAALAFASPGAAVEEVTLFHRGLQPLTLRFAEPENAGRKLPYLSQATHRLFVEDLELKPAKGKESRFRTHKLDLASLDIATSLPLAAEHCLTFSFQLPPATSITVPIRVSGQDPRSGGSFAFGLLLHCTSAMFSSEVTIDIDPAYQRVPLPFEVARVEPESPADRDPVVGLAILPLDSTGPAQRTLGDLRSLPSIETRVQPSSGCSCECECKCCTCSPDLGCVIL